MCARVSTYVRTLDVSAQIWYNQRTATAGLVLGSRPGGALRFAEGGTPVLQQRGCRDVKNKDGMVGCMVRVQAAVCGQFCGGCDAFAEGICCGCGYQLGQTRRGLCALFQCCIVERGLEHCGLCVDFPCELFLSHARPSDVAQCYRNLIRRAEIGTLAWLDEQEGRFLA
jgi:hypothetical protein